MTSRNDPISKGDVWVTGIGLVSCFGEGVERHWEILGADQTPVPIQEEMLYAPYTVHPLPPLDWSQQIPGRGDRRQMENWQRLGTYVAGLALDDANIRNNEELLSTMDLVVAAGGGERDIDSDCRILAQAVHHKNRDRLLLERLPNDLRPTLFLAQLSNLLAGNISIVHKVTGSSRTYMGEENAGVTALENAVARISSGQSSHVLVGGSYNAERPDLLFVQELGGYLARETSDPVIKRQENGGGMITGSVGAFLVIENADFAKTRGVEPYAKISSIVSDLGSRKVKETSHRVDLMFDRLTDSGNPIDAVLSGASGVQDITRQELSFLDRKLSPGTPVRIITSMLGHSMESNFPATVALSALALKKKRFYPPFEESEQSSPIVPGSILVTSFGHCHGEGLALMEKV